MMLVWQHEFSYDKHYASHERICRVGGDQTQAGLFLHTAQNWAAPGVTSLQMPIKIHAENKAAILRK